jgi:Fe2+ transport system protein B
MKTTKTGLHIETRKNRIEVYTKADLQQREKELKEERDFIKLAAVIGLSITLVVLGFIFGLSI